MRLFPLLLAFAFMRCTTAQCGPTTCDGCCDEGGRCQLGLTPGTCGRRGALCVACAPGEQCGLAGCERPRCNLNGCPEPVVPPPQTRNVTLYVTQQLVGERTTTAVSRLTDAGVVLTAGGVERPGVREPERFVVAGVPVGPWVLRYGGQYVAGASSSLDLGAPALGRDDLEFLDAGVASLDLSLSGLAWEPGDRFQLFSVGAGVSALLGESLTAGQTTFSTDVAALGTAGQGPRLDATPGDTLRVVHLEATALGAELAPGGGSRALRCLVAGASAQVEGLTFGPGPNPALASFTATPPRAVRVQLPVGAWDERAREAHPAAVRTAVRWAVQAELVAGAQAGTLLECSHRSTDGWALAEFDVSGSTSSPWPAAWSRVAVAEVEYSVRAGGLSARARSSARVSEGSSIEPAVHAPEGLLVNGFGVSSSVTAWSGASLDVSWTRSAAAPQASDFEVSVVRLEADGREQVVAMALTRGEVFRFPAGLLVPGDAYAVKVRARVTTALEERPYVVPPSSTAEAISNPFLAQ